MTCRIFCWRGRYGRLISVCRVGGPDLGRWLVRNGWAVAYRRYSRDYVGAEVTARAAGLGLWTEYFVMPCPRSSWEKFGNSILNPIYGLDPFLVGGTRTELRAIRIMSLSA